jgi:hypothetical protein
MVLNAGYGVKQDNSHVNCFASIILSSVAFAGCLRMRDLPCHYKYEQGAGSSAVLPALAKEFNLSLLIAYSYDQR